ncbi:MAG: 23S rRNA (cytidine1920-2'-O)/16S rRNA (cytidine1409-2'-O)-methyltransferase [Chloroflexi bacterium]|nr:MAG: 23S rRNA (cytidine1920-2'-O)/16S rRNA (cytidine1409-2'-O)-methyltransferase [Chloroflexota bacterium]
MPTGQQPLDHLLVARGLAADRVQARALIMAGRVSGQGRRYTKPGLRLPPNTTLKVRAAAAYVSRGGEKLVAALDAWPIEIAGRVCLDIGASTGGFSDCLRQHGAARVYAVDVGYGQISSQLRDDPRIIVMERTHVRDLPSLDPAPSLITVDVSFLSARVALEAAAARAEPGADAIVLVKPQFELPRAQVDARGVVTDPLGHASAVALLLHWARQRRWRLGGVRISPLRGPAGNHEFLVWLRAPNAQASNPGILDQ